jgi:hypothetical protein
MKIYRVEMLRFNDLLLYHYCIGVFSTLEQARKIGRSEEKLRGGKYTARIYEMEVGKEYYKVHDEVPKEYTTSVEDCDEKRNN